MTDPLHIRITKAREAANLKKVEVARHLGIRPQAITQWENPHKRYRKNPGHKNLVAFAKLVGTTLDYLLGEVQDLPVPKLDSIIRVDMKSARDVPLLSLDKLMDLNSKNLDIKALSKGVTVPAQFEYSGNLVAFKMQDASMLPDFDEQDLVFVNLDCTARPEDAVAAYIKSDNITVFRNYLFDGPDHVLLQASNPAYRSYRFTLKEWADNVEVIGVYDHHSTRRRRRRHTS